jgi:hypothetical protein
LLMFPFLHFSLFAALRFWCRRCGRRRGCLLTGQKLLERIKHRFGIHSLRKRRTKEQRKHKEAKARTNEVPTEQPKRLLNFFKQHTISRLFFLSFLIFLIVLLSLYLSFHLLVSLSYIFPLTTFIK